MRQWVSRAGPDQPVDRPDGAGGSARPHQREPEVALSVSAAGSQARGFPVGERGLVPATATSKRVGEGQLGIDESRVGANGIAEGPPRSPLPTPAAEGMAEQPVNLSGDAELLGEVLERQLEELDSADEQQLVDGRYDRFRRLGNFKCV